MRLPSKYNLTGCHTRTTSNLLFLFEMPPIETEFVLCVCMLYKARSIHRTEYGSPLLNILVRDRLVYVP